MDRRRTPASRIDCTLSPLTYVVVSAPVGAARTLSNGIDFASHCALARTSDKSPTSDLLRRRDQAFRTEPDADGLFRHLEKLGERGGEPFCVVCRDRRGTQAEFAHFAQG